MTVGILVCLPGFFLTHRNRHPNYRQRPSQKAKKGRWQWSTAGPSPFRPIAP